MFSLIKDLGQSPIQSALFLKACGQYNTLFTTNFLCLNQTLTFCAPSKIKLETKVINSHKIEVLKISSFPPNKYAVHNF